MKRKPKQLPHKKGMVNITDNGREMELRIACEPGNTMNLFQHSLLTIYKVLPPSLKYETALLMLDIAIEEVEEVEEFMRD